VSVPRRLMALCRRVMNTETRMQLTARYVGRVTILAPAGELTVPTAHVFLREARQVLDLTTESRIGVDFTAVRRIDSSGYAALVALLRHVQRRGGEVCLIGPDHEARLLLEIMQLHLLFDVREDVSSAVQALTA
jgi:anti-anti-sigma factor